MNQPALDPSTLWMVLLRKPDGHQAVEVWRAPNGRDGLRRIFRVREPGYTVVSATTMEVLSHLKLSDRPGIWSRMTRGGLQAVMVNVGAEVPNVITVQAHTPDEATKLAEQEGFGPLAAVEMEPVRETMIRMRGILNELSGQVDRDLIKNPPSHTGHVVPSPEELAAVALRDEQDIWTLVSNRTGAR